MRAAALPRSAFCLWAALAVLWAASAPARPQRSAILDLLPGEPGQLVIEPRVELEAIHHSELTGSSQTALPSASSTTSAVTLSGRGLVLEPTGLRVPPISPRVIRELTALWRMTLPPGVETRDLVVSHELFSSSGRRDRFGHPGEPDSEIEVRVRPTGPIEIERRGDEIVVEGGVVLELDLTATRFAGRHAGTLVVTVERR